jgi:hypothetical protein
VRRLVGQVEVARRLRPGCGDDVPARAATANVVEAVAISPMCFVATAIAGSTVSGSRPPVTLPPARPPHSASPSAKKIESNLPRSASCASAW